MAFAKAGNRWINIDNVASLVPGAGGTMSIKLTDGSKLTASEDETTDFLAEQEIDAEAFFADAPEPEPKPAPVNWLTPAPDAEDEAAKAKAAEEADEAETEKKAAE